MASISPATTSTSFSPISMEDATSLLDDCSAIKIQKIWRGFRDRREVKKLARHVLEFPLFQRAIEYIRADLCSLPRAAVGKTPVYLPKEHPIAIKDLGSKKANDRFKRIKQARRLCEINGFHRLVIPKCRIYHDALIENRLPIDPYDLKAQLCLYAEHKDKFTEAVKELTHLLCQARLKHITTRYGDGFQLLSERSPIGRYDNLPLFLEDGIGKIGLIDLERFSLETPQVQKHVESACENLIHLFPHHFDAIMDISKSYCSGITFFYALFKTYGDDALHRLHIVYESHLEFILNQGITLTEPQTIVLPAPEQKETIVGHVFNEAKYNYKLHPFVNPLFGNHSKEAEIHLVTAIQDTIDAIPVFFREVLEYQLSEYAFPMDSFYQLLTCRTLRYKTPSLYIPFLEAQTARFKSQLGLEIIDPISVDCIIHLILKRFQAEELIAFHSCSFVFFDRKIDYKEHAGCLFI